MADYSALSKVNELFQHRLEQIDKNDKLSPEGKRREVAAEVAIASRAHRQIREKIGSKTTKEMRDLERRLVGAGGTTGPPAEQVARAASFRDALDRAVAVPPTDGLSALMRQCIRTGDEVAARAALTVALDRGDVAALNVYVDEHPQREKDLQRLYELRAELSHDATRDVKLEVTHGLPNTTGLSEFQASTIVSGDEELTRIVDHSVPVVVAQATGERA